MFLTSFGRLITDQKYLIELAPKKKNFFHWELSNQIKNKDFTCHLQQ